jgi:hypothetical protein
LEVVAFIPIAGGAPNPGSLLVGINPAAVAFVFGAWDELIKRNILRLHMASGKTVQVEDEDAIEDVLAKLGLEGVEWELRLEGLESRDT